MELSVLRVGPRALVEDALATIEPLAGQKGLELRVESPGGVPPIPTDPDRVRPIQLNLLSNAVKFTDAGTLTVALGATAVLALAGKALPIAKHRGATAFHGQPGFITVHPSYLLRLPDAPAKVAGYRDFVADLKRIHDLAQS
jgi:uracil-DNA glycosylase